MFNMPFDLLKCIDFNGSGVSLLLYLIEEDARSGDLGVGKSDRERVGVDGETQHGVYRPPRPCFLEILRINFLLADESIGDGLPGRRIGGLADFLFF